MNYDELTKKELQELCKENGLTIAGSKVELIKKLEEFAIEETTGEETEVVEEKVEEPAEEPKTEVDLMESETPKVTDPFADAHSHYKGPGAVSGEWLFDDIPGSISAYTLEEALEKYQKTPGIYKVAGSH